MAPTKFSDIHSGPTDLLNDDFTSRISLKCKKDAGPVAVTIETYRGSEGILSSKIGSKFAYAGLSFDKVQLQGDGSHILESSLSPVSGVKLSFKGSKGADLVCDYTSGNFNASGTLDVKDFSKFTTSACLGLSSGMTLGGDVTTNLIAPTGVCDFNVGASYSKGSIFTSLSTANKFSTVNAGILYKVNPRLTLASTSSHSSNNACEVLAVGGSYKSGFGYLKAKVGCDGIVSACVIKEVVPKVSVTASVSVLASELSSFKYGLGVTI